MLCSGLIFCLHCIACTREISIKMRQKETNIKYYFKNLKFDDDILMDMCYTVD